METIILCTLLGVFILISFLFGIKIGMMIPKEEKKVTNKIKSLKPVKSKEFATNDKDEELDEVAKLMHNIEIYDGTAKGQVDV